MVAVLSHALAVIQNRYFGPQIDPGQAAVAALYHDASEILTGDMPTPIKYDNPDIQFAYKQVEAVAEAGRVLAKDETQAAFLRRLTREQDEWKRLARTLGAER